ncbi:hypothetical protein [Paracoccus mutanolyticus]|uniref:hypothetical protein n=1 Tax=Paracoccus mutanolyticus TaxID=1499308 RepID=UPI0011AEB7B5|nr:hypothetical protein [Paracoccus mutanolyticus]
MREQLDGTKRYPIGFFHMDIAEVQTGGSYTGAYPAQVPVTSRAIPSCPPLSRPRPNGWAAASPRR